MKDEEIVSQLYIDLWDASIGKNNEKLNEILSEDYILVHMTGMKQTKIEYINSVLKEELKYYDAIHEEINIKIDNERAYIIGKTKTLASPFSTSKSWWNLRQDLELKKINGKWLKL